MTRIGFEKYRVLSRSTTDLFTRCVVLNFICYLMDGARMCWRISIYISHSVSLIVQLKWKSVITTHRDGRRKIKLGTLRSDLYAMKKENDEFVCKRRYNWIHSAPSYGDSFQA